MRFQNYYLGAASLIAIASPAFAETRAPADDADSDIVVTARRVEENLQDVPVAVTAFSQESLHENAIATAMDLPKAVPGLSAVAESGNPALVSFAIRGRGQSYGAAAGSVEAYFADVPLSSPFQMPGLPPQFFDLANIQVLKGPQGTLFGRSTTGGAVLIVPQTPTDNLEGYARGSLGNYEHIQLEGALNIPLADWAAVRVAAFHWQRDGYMKTSAVYPTLGLPTDGTIIRDPLTGAPLGEQTFNNVNTTEFRASLRLNPLDNLENTTMFTWHRDKVRSSSSSGIWKNVLTNAYEGFPGYGTKTAYLDTNLSKPSSRSWALINTTTLDVSDSIRIKNIFGYVKATGYTNDGADSDGTTFRVIGVYTPHRPRKNAQTTNELQIQGDSGPVNWTLGALMDKTREPVNFVSFGPTSGTPTPNLPGLSRLNSRYQENDIDSYGLYAAGTFAVTDQMNISAGFRHNWDTVKALQAIATHESNLVAPVFGPFNRYKAKFQSNVYNVGVDYRPSDDLMVYAGYRHGYKRGGFNSSAVDPATVSFAPEKVDSFSLGVKSEFETGGMRGHFNIEGFWDLYKGMQVSYLSAIFVPSFALITITTNVPKTRYRGIDMDFQLEPSDWLTLNGAYTFVDSEHTRWPDNTAPGSTLDLTVNKVPFAAKHKLFMAARFHTELGGEMGEIALRPSVSIESKYTMVPFNTVQPAAQVAVFGQFNQLANGGSIINIPTLLDLRGEWNNVANTGVNLALTATNLTNEFYSNGSSGTLNFGFQGNSWAPPRMITFEVSTKF